MKIDPYTPIFCQVIQFDNFWPYQNDIWFLATCKYGVYCNIWAKKIVQAFWYLALLDFLLFQELKILIKVI